MGTVATEWFELDRLTTNPGLVAFPLNCIVAETGVSDPPTTEPVFSVIEIRAPGLIVRRADCEPAAPALAVIVTKALAATSAAVTGKVAETVPAGIVTDEGKEALELLPEIATVKPAGGGDPSKVRVAVLTFPEPTVAGLKTKPISEAGRIVSGPVTWLPPYAAVTVALVDFDTPIVLTPNVIEEEPEGTVTLCGTDRAEELEESVTVISAFAF